ncbi:MAG: hypothetical protein ACO39X_08185, partial [Candidatus Nanopelagicaceae bacterium]
MNRGPTMLICCFSHLKLLDEIGDSGLLAVHERIALVEVMLKNAIASSLESGGHLLAPCISGHVDMKIVNLLHGHHNLVAIDSRQGHLDRIAVVGVLLLCTLGM